MTQKNKISYQDKIKCRKLTEFDQELEETPQED